MGWRVTRVSVEILIILAFLWLLGISLFNVPVLGADAYDHLHWITQFCQSRAEGNWYPHWLGNSFSGLGMPIFYFYPPLPYLAASLIDSIVQSSANQLYHWTIILFSFLSVWTAYIYLRSKEITTRTAIIASLLYAALPYRFVDIVTRSSITEHALFAWVPLIFLAVDRMRARQNRSNTILLASTFALSILTNIVGTAIVFFTAILYSLISKANLRILVRILVCSILGFLLVSFFTFPAFYFRNNIQSQFIFSMWFVPLWEVFASNRSDLYLLSAIHVLLALALVVILWKKGEERIWVWCGTVVVALQLPGIAYVLWPLRHFLQSPNRLNIISSLFIVVALARCIDRRIISGMIAVAVAALVVIIRPIPTIRNEIFTTPIEATGIARYNPPEYLPIWAGNDYRAHEEYSWGHKNDPEIVGNDSLTKITVQNRRLESTAFEYASSIATTIRFHRLYWPTWRL